jgi:hypothetical protein
MLGKTLLALTVFAGTVLSAPAQLHTRVIYGVEWSVTGFNRGLPLPSFPSTRNHQLTQLNPSLHYLP